MQGKSQELLYRSQINQALRFMLENLNRLMTVDEISRAAGFSSYHFHRIFSAYVGETLISYIRRLRMERSLIQLTETNKRIIDIAMECGFESHAAFTKAFGLHFSVSPTEARKGKKVTRKDKQKNFATSKRRFMMKPRIVELNDQRIAYVETKGLVDNQFNKAADQAFEKLCVYLSRNHKWHMVGACLGICPDEPVSTPAEECRYLGEFILKENADINETKDVKIMNMEGGRFAVFRHTGPYETLWQTWSAAYRDWLPSSGEKLRNEMPYEVYLDDKHRTPPEQLRTDIYIALE